MSPGSRVVLGLCICLGNSFLLMIDYNYQMAPSPIVPSGTTNILHFIPRFLLQLRYSSCLNVLKCDLKQGKILPDNLPSDSTVYQISTQDLLHIRHCGGLASPKQRSPVWLEGEVNTGRQMIVTWKSYSGSAQ